MTNFTATFGSNLRRNINASNDATLREFASQLTDAELARVAELIESGAVNR
jgi:hypothetical protein